MTDKAAGNQAQNRHKGGIAVALPIALLLAGCSAFPSSGPSPKAISEATSPDEQASPVQLVDVTGNVSRKLMSLEQAHSFAAELGDAIPYGSIVGKGDALDISIWEAPPAVLFGSVIGLNSLAEAGLGRTAALPEQFVNQDGTVSVPFVGTVVAAGRTPEAISRDIQGRLEGKAHEPQVVVRIVRNAASDVTVVGDVNASVRMPLTTKGERLLDAIASAGGVRQPVSKMTVQITRGSTVTAMPLSTVISSPQENIRLAANDVVTALFQPYSFTVLGAAGRNEEVPFEGTGLTLSQALGRMGGLLDQRANARAVFIFRFEDPALFSGGDQPIPELTPEGKVPVIYRVNLKQPATLFAAQSFPIQDKDVIYVANAPVADFQKFLQAVSQVVYPIISIESAINRF